MIVTQPIWRLGGRFKNNSKSRRRAWEGKRSWKRTGGDHRCTSRVCMSCLRPPRTARGGQQLVVDGVTSSESSLVMRRLTSEISSDGMSPATNHLTDCTASYPRQARRPSRREYFCIDHHNGCLRNLWSRRFGLRDLAWVFHRLSHRASRYRISCISY